MNGGVLNAEQRSSIRPAVKFLSDYYTTDHEPLQYLLHEWQVLNRKIQEKILRLQPKMPRTPSAQEFQGGTSFNASGHHEHRHRHIHQQELCCNSASECASKAPYQYQPMRNTLQETGASHDSSCAPPTPSSDSCSSTCSAHERHTRYTNISTAYRQVSEPYGRHHEIERQRKFLDEYKRLAKPFLPSSASMDILSKPTRLMLGDCARDVYQSIASDWKEANPIVMSTAEDLIVIYFCLKSLTRRQSLLLLKYMNGALKRCAAISQYGLAKVPEGWNILTDDGYLMYTLRPDWVKAQRFLPPSVVPLPAS
ncbi:unnamed protein product [Phytomonas sp. EM1]|nr:unnamed protein product [Phytomonas sp. EM1]|eukprot:CCW63056.1 unnamed protein product [Phytomonas sp. isolate EM1]